ncbi:MAG: tetratricopeptide repeat protein [Candidatus Krumholzibacteriota bacterium]|nr:tetratricopeptide repeat protein [Candidatus Krumholzibacteriota bacterium]
MPANTAIRGQNTTGRAILAFATLCLALGLVPARGRADETPSAELTRLGIEFEAACLLEAPQRAPACEGIEAALATLADSDAKLAREAAFRMLLGAVRRAGGDHAGAREAFAEAEDRAGRGPLADDAAFAAAEALGALGDDERAAKAWAKWLDRYDDSPLRGEVLLDASWNALRRGERAEARRACDALLAERSWLESDPRVALLRAALAYADGDPAAALALLVGAEEGAAVLFLTALCQQASGASIKAAASFQKIVDRHPRSPLRDHARLAKANIFFAGGALESASEDYGALADGAAAPGLRAEAMLRRAAALYRLDRPAEATGLLNRLVAEHAGGGAAARAQFLLGEFLREQGEFEQAVVEYNKVLADYFEDEVAATAQYRIGRCLDAMGRGAEATSAYQAVVAGYPLQPEAPAAAYLAGNGLMAQDRPREAAVYFQQVLDRYLAAADGSAAPIFDSADQRELIEASLCLLEYAYHAAGDLGQLSGTPHLLLERIPPSDSPWRAYALLLDADALAAQGRYEEAEGQLGRLLEAFAEHPAVIPSYQLLAWVHSRQGRDEEAIAIEEMLLDRYGGRGGEVALVSSTFNMAHLRFNQKRYGEAAALYEQVASAGGDPARRREALYQAGLCYLRLDRAGDAIDRWRRIVAEAPGDPAAEKVWSRMGDLYFLAESYGDARRAYEGLLANFAGSDAAPRAMLRIARCDYNTGDDAAALESYSALIDRYPGTVHADEARRGIEMSLYRLVQQPGGEKLLSELVDRFPGSHFAADAQYRIAARLYEDERYLEAAQAFRRLVSQFPSFASADRAQYLMATSFEQAGRDQDAKRGYEQFTCFFPDSDFAPTVHFKLGMLHFASEDYLRAAVSFTTVLDAEEPTEFDAAARFNLALCEQLLGRADEARADFERYREQHPGDERLLQVAYQLGLLHEEANRLDAAVAEYGTALGLGPEPAVETELRFRRGSCLERAGDREAALAEYRQVLARDTGDDPFRVSAAARCAAIYEEAEDYANALRSYRQLIKHAKDPELVAVATDRVAQLETIVR